MSVSFMPNTVGIQAIIWSWNEDGSVFSVTRPVLGWMIDELSVENGRKLDAVGELTPVFTSTPGSNERFAYLMPDGSIEDDHGTHYASREVWERDGLS